MTASTPILVLGCHRSGTSAVAGLLVRAAGVSMGELMPATEDNPLGYYEAIGVVDAHRHLLGQLDRDWTCPPSSIDATAMDLSVLATEVAAHQSLPTPWAVKDPRSMFLLPAWSALGVDTVRLVAVVRPVADTIRSLVRRDGIREDRAEAIVDAYLERLVSIAEQVPLPVVEFPGEDTSVVDQVRALALSSGLDWDEDAALAFYSDELVRNRSPLRDPTELYERLLELSPGPSAMADVQLSSLRLDSTPPWPLETHLGPNHGRRANALWDAADLSSFADPTVVEIVRDGARVTGPTRPGVTLRRVAVSGPAVAGAAVYDTGVHPHGLVCHELLDGLDREELERLLRAFYVATHPLGVLVLDVPEPHGEAVVRSRPSLVARPRPQDVRDAAEPVGWEVVSSRPMSPTRTAVTLRKAVPTDSELLPVVTSLLAAIPRLDSIEARVEALDPGGGRSPATPGSDAALRAELEEAHRRADLAERSLTRLHDRRSVRVALRLAEPWRPLFRLVRSWRR